MKIKSMKPIPSFREPTRYQRTDMRQRTTETKEERPSDKYTTPKVNYEYQTVSWEEFMADRYTGYKSVRSSFIPTVIKDGERHWLLGSFHDFPNEILMDFGGSCVKWDPPRKYSQGQNQSKNLQHQFGCAMLELNEESKGLLVQPVLHSLGTVKPVVYRGTDRNRSEYVWFVLVQLPYEKVVNIPAEFLVAPYVHEGEELGPLGFYKESDILGANFQHRTSQNLTDFINYLKREHNPLK